MIIASTIILLIGILLCCYGKYKLKNINEVNNEVALINERLQEQNDSLLKDKNEIESSLDKIKNEYNITKKAFNDISSNLDDLTNQQQKYLEEQYKIKKDILEKDFETAKYSIQIKKDKLDSELESLKATKEATLAAYRREQEIKENKQFYCLSIDDVDLNDIRMLNSIKSKLIKPRILSMLIWQTYYQKPLKALTANVVGKDICGIYKITNTKNDIAYIGQAVDIPKRWAEHAKCGLGIDTPPGNKLYKAMAEDGLESFSWEVLENCEREKLNEKERYYIDLYGGPDFTYNSIKGNK